MIEATKPNFPECQYLTLEAREDARGVRTNVWAESMNFLNGRSSGSLISSNPKYWKITVQEIIPSKEKPVDLEIEGTAISDDIRGNFFKKETFSFHMDNGGYIMKTVRFIDSGGQVNEIEKIEIGKAELTKLLETLRESRRIEEGIV